LLGPDLDNWDAGTQLNQIRGKRIEVEEMTDVAADAALLWFFEEVRETLGIDFSPLLEEQKNPISLRRWKANRIHKVTLKKGFQDAALVLEDILRQCRWHWTYSAQGRVIIHAWAKGDQVK